MPADQVQVFNAAANQRLAEPVNRISSLIERVQSARQRVADCEQHFVDQLQYLHQLQAVTSESPTSSTLIRGLFYRAESGLFCVYDQRRDEFRALVEPDFVG